MGDRDLKRRCFGVPGLYCCQSKACAVCCDAGECKSTVIYLLRQNIGAAGASDELTRIDPDQVETSNNWTAAVLKRFTRSTLSDLVRRGADPFTDRHPALHAAFLMLMRGGFTRPQLVMRLQGEKCAKKTAENHATKAIQSLQELGLAQQDGCRFKPTVLPDCGTQNYCTQ